ncbi:MAG: HNH endonuclease [Bosea sp.]|uniref:HNH endonuclease signature motif containing protein n=1 Tax=Bosea sp. (in: a-proteobacteria) TaxID=1871050 RepID=UPI001AC54899|nr:HNH endonuclease [Bosea sp. (in: a-proteobacteria)]
MIPESFAARFWAKVDKRAPEECWRWTASVNEHGYGRIATDRRRGPVLAHRASYEMHYGSLPEGKIVRHKCDNPRCVNPGHLVAGSHAENTADMMRRGRHHSATVTSCPKGHPYLPGSYYQYSGRQCRACSLARADQQRRRRSLSCEQIEASR